MFGYDWPRFHAAVNDLPAALLFVSVLFELVGWWRRRDSLTAAAYWTLWVGVIGGWVAVLAGEEASDVIEHGDALHDLMETHETLALTAMTMFTVILIVKLVRRARLTQIEDAALRLLSIAGFVTLIWAARLGGEMVFDHAAGITAATMQQETRDRAAGHHHHPGETDEDAAPTPRASDSVRAGAPTPPPRKP